MKTTVLIFAISMAFAMTAQEEMQYLQKNLYQDELSPKDSVVQDEVSTSSSAIEKEKEDQAPKFNLKRKKVMDKLLEKDKIEVIDLEGTYFPKSKAKVQDQVN